MLHKQIIFMCLPEPQNKTHQSSIFELIEVTSTATELATDAVVLGLSVSILADRELVATPWICIRTRHYRVFHRKAVKMPTFCYKIWSYFANQQNSSNSIPFSLPPFKRKFRIMVDHAPWHKHQLNQSRSREDVTVAPRILIIFPGEPPCTLQPPKVVESFKHLQVTSNVLAIWVNHLNMERIFSFHIYKSISRISEI